MNTPRTDVKQGRTMSVYQYAYEDFRAVATGAAILASGGGGSYTDAMNVLAELAQWQGTVTVQDYNGNSNCGVLALMGSPDAADNLTLADIANSVANTVAQFGGATGYPLECVIPVEIGAINSIVPLIAALMNEFTGIQWVVNGDGAGRAVPELPQTTYSGSMPVSPTALANNAGQAYQFQAAALIAPNATQMENLAGGIVSAFGSVSGIALWPSNADNGFALNGNYIAGTLEQARQLGLFLLNAASPPSASAVASQISQLCGRPAAVIADNFYITSVSQTTTSQSLDSGVIRLDNAIDPANSTDTRFIYNLNENLIMYSAQSNVPDIIAPDSICYYSSITGRGFSNATDDLALYYDSTAGRSTGKTVSILRVAALPQFYQAPGVVSSFATLLRNIGYAGALPYSG